MDEEYERIELDKIDPIYQENPEHAHVFREEPDPDYPDRVYLVCRCGHGMIISK